MMFFSSVSFPVWQVVLGQYVGIGLLVAISTLGLFISLVVPAYIIGLLGIVPIAIGTKKIIKFRKNDKSTSKHAIKDSKNNLAFMAVALCDFFKWWRQYRCLYTTVCKIQFCNHSNLACNSFHGNDCYLV